MVSQRGPKSHHVVPNPDGGWDVKRGGAERASGNFDTKREAVDRGREISRNQETELRIHNRDGRIGQSDSHGRDPNPPRG
jgi:Uncharacterized protein conserved in bacteria (DUF2188)